ncbi:unnamed protein product [Ceutorhynchus assimilis]|uniref:Small-subunit processome Utp12 domain-containing protein n=1 Tax=Ceutorhynchus assimilis TaxID=467358 RepID=A0A9N9QLL6_9CUCU|nr:unnamed protein product [Ceutorhynchus assimilis]
MQFSEDGKYFAQISAEGKLRIWNSGSNSLEQEFTPDYHLTAPFTCLHFWNSRFIDNNKTSPSPKRKKRKSGDNQSPDILLGTTSGLIQVYSISKASIDFTINSKTGSKINCLTSNATGSAYSGADQNILEWNLHKKELKSQWKAGNEIVTAILALPDLERLVTASKNIKLWDLGRKELLKTFTGHSSDVVTTLYVCLPDSDTFLLTGSKADRLLSCWNLTADVKRKSAICNFLMEDVVENVAVNLSPDGDIGIAAVNKSGAVHVYRHNFDSKCDKPVKPKTTVQVVSAGQSNDPVKPIRIFSARFVDSDTLSVAHGADPILTFENVVLTSKKSQVLVRIDPLASKQIKDSQVTKLKKPVIGDDVHYSSEALPSKRKTGIQEEIPMEQRLENLTLSKTEAGKVPKVDNVARLLMQGLHSKDKNILRTALCRKDETVIRNTVKRLPVTVFEALIWELSGLVHGKTILSHFGALWLKHLAQVHAGVLISNPNLAELFSGALNSIYSRINTQTALSRLRGKLELLVPQVITTDDARKGDDDEALLVFDDKDSSDSDSDDDEMQIEILSDNEPEEWEEADENDSEPMENGADSSDSESSDVVLVNGEVESD